MRILYVDIDSCRADHLGCYGYHRNTSPTIDRLASEGTRFEHCYVSDAPCLPSRSAMAFGRFGIHTGAVNHGGARSEPFDPEPERGFRYREGHQTLFQVLQAAGYRTASISPFPDRHGAHWLTAGLHEWYNTGRLGYEIADEVNAVALPWLEQHAAQDQWFLHLNYWDPHTPYRTPATYDNPFASDPPPAWLTEESRARQYAGFGAYGARDLSDWWSPGNREQTREGTPTRIESLQDWKAWIDGYDTGVRYADDHLAALLETLERHGVLEDTLVIITADHGESQGEHNVYGDHQTADSITSRVPFILRGPGVEPGRVNRGLHYQFDLTATVLELAGGDIPSGWDARSIGPVLGETLDGGRESLVVSQMAWSCQRSVRWDRYLLTRTYHNGFKDLPPVMLFDLEADPHETENLAGARPDLVDHGLALLEEWHALMLSTSTAPEPIDPMQTVLREGGPFHTRGRLEWYCGLLRATGREHFADALQARAATSMGHR